MANLHISEVDADVLARLRERADAEGCTLEALIRDELRRTVEEKDAVDEAQTLRMPPSDRSFRDVDPVDAPGISASELLIRDRRR